MVYYPLGKATGQLNGWNMGQQILIPLRLRAGFGFGCPTSGTVYDQFASLLIEFITQTFTSQNRQYPTPKRGESGEVASSIPPYDFILIIIVIESPNLRGCDYTVFFFIFYFLCTKPVIFNERTRFNLQYCLHSHSDKDLLELTGRPSSICKAISSA